MDYDQFTPEQKVMVLAAADLGKQYLLR